MRLLRWLLLPAVLGSVSLIDGEPWPVIRGTSAGTLNLGEPWPAVPWNVLVEPAPGGGLTARLETAPPDAQFQATLVLDSTERGTWQIEQGEAAIGAWWARVAPQLVPEWASTELDGTLQVSGAGTWSKGAPHGELSVQANLPAIESTEPAFSLGPTQIGLSFVKGEEAEAWSGAGTLTIATARWDPVEATDLTASFSVRPDGALRLDAARFYALGGVVEAAPVSWKPGQSEIAMGLTLTGVDLKLLAPFLPQVVRDARGQVSGRIALRWREGLGFQAIGGELKGAPESPVQLRLAPRPGFLTQNVPQRFQLLPKALGRLSDWFAPANPVYTTLERIELGEEPLSVNTFEVQLFPPDDPLGRSARIFVSGRPRHDPQVEEVSLTINLSGPLSDLLRAGMTGEVEFGSGKPSTPPK